MNSIDNFLSNVYSEEIYNFSESDYAEVMSATAIDQSEDFDGYTDWSESIEGDVDNFEIRSGMLYYKGEGLKRGPFVGGIEV